MRHYHDYIGKILNQSENIHRSYKTYTANMNLIKNINIKYELLHEVVLNIYNKQFQEALSI